MDGGVVFDVYARAGAGTRGARVPVKAEFVEVNQRRWREGDVAPLKAGLVHFDGVTVLPHDELAHDVVHRAQHVTQIEITRESPYGHRTPSASAHRLYQAAAGAGTAACRRAALHRVQSVRY